MQIPLQTPPSVVAALLAVTALTLSACAEGATSSYTQGPLALGGSDEVPLADGGSFERGVPSYASVAGNALLPVNPAPRLVIASASASTLGASVAAGLASGTVSSSILGIPVGAGLAGGADALGAGALAGPASIGVSLSPTSPTIGAEADAIGGAASVTPGSPSATVQAGIGSAGAGVTAGAPVTTGAAGTTVTPTVTLTTQGSLLGAVGGLVSTGSGSPGVGSNPLIVTGALNNKKNCNPLLMRC